MLDPPAHLWLSQAHSDFCAAKRVYQADDDSTYCQAIAKYQQVVEKSVKALATGLQDAKIAQVSRSHYYKHDVERLAQAIRHSLAPKNVNEIHSKVAELFNEHYREEIRILSSFAPHRPPPGAPHQRNTEYPFQNANGDWTAPAIPKSFNSQEVTRFKDLAVRIWQRCNKIISALPRLNQT